MVYQELRTTQKPQLAAVGCPEPLLYYCSIVIFCVACKEERVAAPVNLSSCSKSNWEDCDLG